MSTTPKILTTSDVSLHTATIEVKVMKIGNRQVTLSVFRQLPEERIIDLWTGELCGVPWGRVNYHVGCETMSYRHLHVVWQKGNELRHAIVSDWKYRSDLGYDPTRNYMQGELAVIEPVWCSSYAQLEQLDQLFIAV